MSRAKFWGHNYANGDVKGYEALAETLQLAYNRAAVGKGKERHANDNPFIQQEICEDLRIFGIAPALFQARKKIKESARLPRQEAINELLDAIVYLSAAVIVEYEAPQEEPEPT
jgi:hypothetical protein